MSTRQTWSVPAYNYAADIARQESLRRQAELEQMRAARALAEAAQRRAEHQAALDRTGQSLAQSQDSLRKTAAAVLELDQSLQRTQEALRVANDRLRQCQSQAACLETSASNAAAQMAGAVQTAAALSSELSQLGEMNVDALVSLAAHQDAAAQWAHRAQQFEDGIRQKQAEYDLLHQTATSQPAASAILLAMEESGYRLRETVTQGDLIAYFQKVDAEQMIAVRIAPPPPGAASRVIETITAETFHAPDPQCLGELDDFETALADRLPIKRLGERVYPRPDGAAELPNPQRVLRPRKTVVKERDREVAG